MRNNCVVVSTMCMWDVCKYQLFVCWWQSLSLFHLENVSIGKECRKFCWYSLHFKQTDQENMGSGSDLNKCYPSGGLLRVPFTVQTDNSLRNNVTLYSWGIGNGELWIKFLIIFIAIVPTSIDLFVCREDFNCLECPIKFIVITCHSTKAS